MEKQKTFRFIHFSLFVCRRKKKTRGGRWESDGKQFCSAHRKNSRNVKKKSSIFRSRGEGISLFFFFFSPSALCDCIRDVSFFCERASEWKSHCTAVIIVVHMMIENMSQIYVSLSFTKTIVCMSCWDVYSFGCQSRRDDEEYLQDCVFMQRTEFMR